MIKFENKQNGRFYYIHAQKDLFNDAVLCITRGGKNISVNRLLYCHSQEHMQAEINRLIKVRLQRGYTLLRD